MASTGFSTVFFDENDPKYRCCCRCCHVRCGSFIIAILQACELLSMVSKLGKSALNFGPEVSPAAYIPTIVSVVYLVCYLVCIVFLFIGLCTGKSNYLTPTLIMFLFIIGLYVILIIFTVVVLIVGSETLVDYVIDQIEMDKREAVQSRDSIKSAVNLILGVFIVVMIIAILVELWWFFVIKACRTYFEDWAAFNPGGQYTSGSAMFGRSYSHQYSVPSGPGTVILLQQQPIPPSGPHYPPSVPQYPQSGSQYPPSNHQAYNPPHNPDDEGRLEPPSYNETMNYNKGGQPT